MMSDRLKALKQKSDDLGLPSLLPRPWCQLKAPAADDQIIRVMQWNVLAQALSKGEDNFVLCPGKALQWEVRRVRLIEEILTRTPGIVCLEEVDMMTHFNAELSQVGYEGLFFSKLWSPCLDVQDNSGPDGCAIFYLKDRLTLLSHDDIKIYVPPGRTLCNQVGLLATFSQKCVSQPRAFHVVVTHLKAKSGYEDLRRKQAEYLTDWVWQRVGEEPVIICGDFNGQPTEPFYEVMQNSKLNLTSVYRLLTQGHQEPPYTTWKVRGMVNGQAKVIVEEQHMTKVIGEKQETAEVKREEQRKAEAKGEEQRKAEIKREEQRKAEIKREEQRKAEVKREEQRKAEVKSEEQQRQEVKETVQGRRIATTESCSTIDYIWLSEGQFSALGLLGLPREQDIGSGRLPSLAYPSDHLSLVCDLILKN
ncbi:nocturnin-like [Liolophura sinensis]|uniref:nocturnin-like n=1 Tax=Liolophura sinensis TaxID=3198878 RepID=UPI0031591C1B